MVESTSQKTQANVFYSWQSDLPNATNRGLIGEALERAVKRVGIDESLRVEPVVDRDTQNVPGAPDIAHTIFQKIEKAAAFVADVSIINPGLGRPTPNPNVLIEVGYALKTLGGPRTVLVANTANGPVESLPFDLRTRRVLTYHLSQGGGDKPEQRKQLQNGLELALRTILTDVTLSRPPLSLSDVDKAIESIETGASSQGSLCAKIVPAIANRVMELTPKLRREDADTWDEDLVDAIHQTIPLVTDFARVADMVAVHNSQEAALGLFRGFPPLFSQYTSPPGFSGSFYEVQFDLPKFVGHELMVTLVSALIGERRWDVVAELCRETVMIPNSEHRFQSETPVTYIYASQFVKLLEGRNTRLKLNRSSLHADILKERHEAGELGHLSSWRRFQDADVFLYLRSILGVDEFDLWDAWRPWSAVLLRGCPGYLLEAEQREKAAQLQKALGLRTLNEFRTRLKERGSSGLRQLFSPRNPFYSPLPGLNPDLIGTK